MVPTQSVYGPRMVEFKESHDSTGQGQGYQGMGRLKRQAVRSEALTCQRCPPLPEEGLAAQPAAASSV